MEQDKKYNNFDNSYDMAQAVQEIIDTGTTDEVKFAELLIENKCSEEFITKISSQSQFEKENTKLEKAYNENGADIFVRKLKTMERARGLRRRLIALSAAAASIIAISIFIFVESNTIVANKDLSAENIKIPTIIFDNSSKLEIEGDGRYVSEKRTEQMVNSDVVPHYSECRLVVPHGYTFTIVLNDGTEVTLNAGSELTYPETFGGESRNVKLKGEGYFKVTKSDKPFIVDVEQSYIKVYGTEFNVDAMNTKIVKTVLVEGSVGVGFRGVEGEVKLKPNEMATMNMTNKNSEVTAADVEKNLAWMRGYFVYSEEPLEDMLVDLAAWHNVEFEFSEDSIRKISMVGSFNRTNTLLELLTMIEETTGVKFVKEGGKKYYIVK